MSVALPTDRLRALREERGWSQRELSIRCGFGEAQVNKHEEGANDPSATVLRIMAEQLNVSTNYLVGLVDEPRGILGQMLTPDEQRLIAAYDSANSVAMLELITERIRQAEANQ